MKYTLHYAGLGCDNIPEQQFKSVLDIAYHLGNKKNREIENKVFLLSFYDKVNKKDLTFVSEHFDFIIDTIRNTHFSFDVAFADNIFIQEYDSFEDAYSVALSMKENSQLCYAK